MTSNEILAEEVEVINAIFGENTCQIIACNSKKTRVQLRLPPASYESFKPELVGRHQDSRAGTWERATMGQEIAFLADFPATYPREIPQIISFNTSLYDDYHSHVWKVHLAMLIFLKKAFVAGEVCIYDWFLLCDPAVHCLRPEGFDWAQFAKTSPEFNLDERDWRWVMRRTPPDLKNALDPSECTICLDEHSAYEMVDLRCGHMFCTDCFHEGWNDSVQAKEPYRCCNQRVSADLIKIFVGLDKAQTERYARLLLERDTPQPIYCIAPDCSGFLGSLLDFANENMRYARCPECAISLCLICRDVSHGGDCDVSEFLEVMKRLGIRRCPRCGYATMKNGGCSHMRCKGCGANYTWQRNGGLVPW